MAAKVLLLAGACNALVAPSQPTKTKLRAATLEEVERIPTPAFGKTFGDDVSKLKAAIFHYGATLDRGEQPGQRRRVVGEIGVHFDHEVEAVRETVTEPVAVRRAATRLGRTPHDLHLSDLGTDPGRDVGRAVGARVVDHEDVGRRHGGAQPLQHLGDVVGLVERRKNHQ